MDEIERLSPRELIENAGKRGTLSPESTRALQKPAVVQQVQQALENSYSVKRAGELLLVTMMPDDSGSMAGSKQDAVIAGHNELLAAMIASSVGKNIMLQTRYLNGTVLNPFSPLIYCQQLNITNYPCNKGTPLFQQTLVMLGTIMAKTEELTSRNAKVRTASLLMTDAESTEHNAAELQREVAGVVRDMRRIGDHIVAGMGFTTAGNDDKFREVFAGMGIDPQYVFTAASREEILKAFRMFTEQALELTARGGSIRKVHEG